MTNIIQINNIQKPNYTENKVHTTIYLIRHGQTESNREQRYVGHTDVELNETGEQQAAKVGRWLKNMGVTTLYTSDLTRALHTTEIISEIIDNDNIHVSQQLREVYFGKWENMSIDEIKAQYPEHFAVWREDPASSPIPQAESMEGFRVRVKEFLNTITERHKSEKVAIVTHGGFIKMALCNMLDMPISSFWRIRQDNAAINHIELGEAYPIAKFINYLGHLEESDHINFG